MQAAQSRFRHFSATLMSFLLRLTAKALWGGLGNRDNTFFRRDRMAAFSTPP
jgi:hypothetical protein